MSDHDELAHKLPKFDLGQVVATPAAIVAIEFAHSSAIELLQRHVTGDWGDLSAEDKALNDRAIEKGERIVSAYTLADGERLYIITEWNRSVTTILLASEY
jgi:hypothetical protein